MPMKILTFDGTFFPFSSLDADFSVTLTTSDIEAIQQAVIWYYTNHDDEVFEIADLILNEAVDNSYGIAKDDMSVITCKFIKSENL